MVLLFILLLKQINLKKLGTFSMRSKKANGFILVVVLIFLTVIALMSLFNLMQIKQGLYLLGNKFYQRNIMQAALTFARTAENTIPRKCLINPIPLIEKNMAWWRLNGCSASSDNNQFYY